MATINSNIVGVRHRHKVDAHYGYHLCSICGARRTANTYKPWAYGYPAWAIKGKSIGQWCPGPQS